MNLFFAAQQALWDGLYFALWSAVAFVVVVVLWSIWRGGKDDDGG